MTFSERLVGWAVIILCLIVLGVGFGVAIVAELEREARYDVPGAVRDSYAGAIEVTTPNR